MNWIYSVANDLIKEWAEGEGITYEEEIDEIDEPELTQDQVDKYLYKRNLVAVDAMMVHQLGKKEEQS